MSHSIVAELAAGHKTNRPDVAQIHIDTVHHPQSAFHFEINWLGATAYCIDEYVKSLARNIERFGLRMVESPVLSPLGMSIFRSKSRSHLMLKPEITIQSPLRENAKLSFATLPAGRSGIEVDSMIFRFLEHLDYLLDTEADNRMPQNVVLRYSYRRGKVTNTVFMHSSGLAIVQVLENAQGLVWSPNRLFASRASKSASNSSPEHLFKVLSAFCNDSSRLADFWKGLEEGILFEQLEGNTSKGG